MYVELLKRPSPWQNYSVLSVEKSRVVEGIETVFEVMRQDRNCLVTDDHFSGARRGGCGARTLLPAGRCADPQAGRRGWAASCPAMEACLA